MTLVSMVSHRQSQEFVGSKQIFNKYVQKSMQNFFLCNAPGFEIFLEILVVKKHRHIQSIKLHMDLGYSTKRGDQLK